MGINNLYKEIGSGQRIALSKLAVEHYESYGRPFRLAIDISIWSFQNQAASGGKNPELRTLYFRLIRLLSLSIQPLFVFDGPHKPPFKRGVRTNYNAAASAYFFHHTKQLLTLFGFPQHQAPGEAEAECAVLQRKGIVDAVLTEDVDSLMFGCKVHLRNWSSASTKGKSPTHVDLYRQEAILTKSGLDGQGMILIALMSGGDYVPEGVPGCGIKIACQAARAGFGIELCKISEGDDEAYQRWRDWLQHELETNDGGYFQRTHKALRIPESFPSKVVMNYYRSPVISSESELEQLPRNIHWESEINVAQLRLFVAEMFEWQHLSGARKYMRGLAPALLVGQLRKRAGTSSDDLAIQEMGEKRLVKLISGRRHHFETDGMPELRISYLPTEIVKLNLEEEAVSTNEIVHETSSDERASESGQSINQSPRKPRAISQYDPSEVQKVWLLETYVKIGVPLMAENWEEAPRNPKKSATSKIREAAGTTKRLQTKSKTKAASSSTAKRPMDAFVKLSKPGLSHLRDDERKKSSHPTETVIETDSMRQEGILLSHSKRTAVPREGSIEDNGGEKATGRLATPLGDLSSRANSSLAKQDHRHNPWSKSKRPADTLKVKLPSGTRYSALGIDFAGDEANATGTEAEEDDMASINPSTQPLESPTSSRKHGRPPSASSADEPIESRTTQDQRGIHTSTANDQGIAVLDLTTISDTGPRTQALTPKTKPRLPTPKQPRAPLTSRQGPSVPAKQQSRLNFAVKKVPQDMFFESQNRRRESPSSDLESLPSPSILLSVKASQGTECSTETLHISTSPSSKQGSKKTKGHVIVRESLEGAWRDVGPVEAVRKPAKTVASVDIIDLT